MTGSMKENWARLDADLTRLTNEILREEDKKNHDIVIDFIENREYGVALEWMSSVINEKPIVLSSTQLKTMLELAALMGIDLGKFRR
jgi:hypothetical protein